MTNEENNEYISLLKKQNTLLKIILGFMGTLVLSILISIIIIVPKLNKLLVSTTDTVTQLNVVATELKEADIKGLVEDTRSLIDDSETTVVTAMEKIDSIDIEKLNDAVSELESVVAPLAKLFGKK